MCFIGHLRISFGEIAIKTFLPVFNWAALSSCESPFWSTKATFSPLLWGEGEGSLFGQKTDLSLNLGSATFERI